MEPVLDQSPESDLFHDSRDDAYEKHKSCKGWKDLTVVPVANPKVFKQRIQNDEVIDKVHP